tara:strand:- start:1647 stop:2138 length:492 start_codon:yes stop_codon:yes gene_type:complete
MFNIVVVFICLIIDQLSKLIITSYHFSSFPKYIISDFLKLTYITNNGIAFGLNPFGGYRFVLLIVSIVAVLFVVKILIDSKDQSQLNQFGLALILGGALGNLVDRFLTAFNIMGYTGVIDFIDIGIKQYRFYIFNFADFFISLGIILYLISFIRSRFINDGHK